MLRAIKNRNGNPWGKRYIIVRFTLSLSMFLFVRMFFFGFRFLRTALISLRLNMESEYIEENEYTEETNNEVESDNTTNEQLSELIEILKDSQPTEEEQLVLEEEKQVELDYQAEQEEINSEFRSGVISNLELLNQSVTLLHSDNEILFSDFEVLATNQETIYKQQTNIQGQLDFICLGLCINGFLIALGVGFLISKLIIERFK